MTLTIPRPLWSSRLEAFTLRNAGRRALLELDDPTFGAQPVADYPLWGISYDPVGDRISIMFHDFRDPERHMSHGIPHARSIDLLQECGREEVLRIVGEEGEQTLLRLVSPVADSATR